MSEVVAIIPARGGSKGIPRKNMQRVGGVPLVARAVEAARRCPAVDRVVVTTDDTDIAAVAAEWGAEVVERPAAALKELVATFGGKGGGKRDLAQGGGLQAVTADLVAAATEILSR